MKLKALLIGLSLAAGFVSSSTAQVTMRGWGSGLYFLARTCKV